MPTIKVKDFINKIMQIESSGGRDIQHPEMQHGIHEGHKAIGRYGLMPNTVKELINRRRTQGTMTPELQDLDAMSPEQIKATIESRPDLEDQFAEQLGTKVIRQQGGDEDKAAFSWNQGHNIQPANITEEKIKESPYVQKYQKLQGLMKKDE